MAITFTTNNHDRETMSRHDVPSDVLKGVLDWTDSDMYDGYIQYLGCWYHLSQFMRVGYPGPFGQTCESGYHGYHCDSFFSGIAIKLTNDGETYRIATYYHASN